MRVRVLTVSLALVIGGSMIGCKSAPKLAWWKTADTAPAGAATATTAASAPQLPSEVAKQAEGLSTANPVQITTAPATTVAPGYTAAVTPSAYPTTGAKDYLSSPAAFQSAASSTVAGSSAPVKTGMPYDPAAVPPPANTVATSASTANAAVQADRYGLTTPDRYANAYPETSPDYSSAAGASAAAAAPVENLATAPPATSAPFASNSNSTTLGDRYATQGGAAVPTAETEPSYTTSVQPASAVASVQPYRPGGTSSYPGTSTKYEIASQPGSTTSGGYGNSASGTLYR